MRIARDSGKQQAVAAAPAAAEYVDPRDLTARSPLRDLVRAFLQEQLDKGRSPRTLPKYEQYLSQFVGFIEGSSKSPRVSDIDLRTLKAYSSHLTRRQLRSGDRKS